MKNEKSDQWSITSDMTRQYKQKREQLEETKVILSKEVEELKDELGTFYK